jgi:CubicO group peptidase (beta-lactamase class C family)
MTTFNVPGLAIAVVKDTEVIYLEGFGKRDVAGDQPVTPRTLFAIGSSTKAFTTFVLGTLVDEGLLDWDQPVRHWIPWFELADPVVTERITPRDLVTHRSGLPRHDLVWYNNYNASRQELVEKMAYLDLNADLRERFQYNNLMFLTAGYLTEVVTEKSWEEAVRERILIPLEMTRTNFSVQDSQADPDHALPYREEKEKLEAIPFRQLTNVGPAGSINSSAEEMSHWVMVHLNQGLFGDRSVMSPAPLQDMHLAHMVTGETPERPQLSPANYGLGWFLQNYRGHPVVHHGGNIDGFSAMVALFPQDGFGMVILTNLNGTPLRDLLVWHVADRLLSLEPVDWMGEAAARRAKSREIGQEAEQKKSIRKKAGTRPAHAMADYAGVYAHAGYGRLEVTLADDQLVTTYNGIATPLEHWHYETFNGLKADDDVFEDMKYTFYTDEKGNIASLSVPFEPTVSPIVFDRQPADKYFDPEYLLRFTGEYDMETARITVGLRGDALTLSVPGQSLVDLEPDLGDEFVIKQYSVVSVGFVTDEAGNVTALELYQPNGVFTAKKIGDDDETK